jgi:hypothetical protein
LAPFFNFPGQFFKVVKEVFLFWKQAHGKFLPFRSVY